MKNRNAIRLLWTLILILALTFVAAGAVYGADAVMIVDVAPFIENGLTFDTVRPIAETFGIYVSWDQAEQKVTLMRGAYRVVFTVGASELTRITPEGEKTAPIDTPPLLKDGRVFIPTRLWAEVFGLQVEWNEENRSVTVSEGIKALNFTPGQKEFHLTDGHFLKLYHQDESLSFFYPSVGNVDVVWEGYAEVLMNLDGNDYVIVAVNAGAGRSDPIYYTQEELEKLVYQNAGRELVTVTRLSDTYYGVPAYRFSGPEAGVPQSGVIFLKDGVLCGLTIETRRTPGQEIFTGNTLEIVDEDGTAIEPEEREEAPAEADTSGLLEELALVNAILDEIMASFMVM